MDAENTQQADEARKRGNELYKSHQISQAINAYKEAAALAPLDPFPLSNLSIANFEAGKYAQCIHFSNKALELLNADDQDTSIARHKLLVRKVKACLHLSLLDEAEKLLRELGSSKESENLRNSVRAMNEFKTHSTSSKLLREVILQLPRLRPCIQDNPDFFGSGNEEARSLYTADLEKSAEQDPVLSIMLCGVGDARNVFQTLIQYSSMNHGTQKLHITMLDHKPSIIARDLILFSLLHEANTNPDSKDTVLLSLSYLYSTPIIPLFAWEKLQNTISKLVDKLECGQQPLDLIYLTLPQTDVMRILKSWQTTGAATKYSTSQMRRAASQREDPLWSYLACDADYQDFYDFSVVFPPEAILSRFEPTLSALVTGRSKDDENARRRIGKYLDKHWKVNVTFIDVDWQARQMPGELPSTDHEPFNIIDNLTTQSSKLVVPDKSTRCILQHAADFFGKVALSMLQLRERLTVEVILGEMADVLERIRYGFLDRPIKGGDEDQVSSTAMEWPKKYHVIHMSNVPDYVGGSLTSFLYGAPLLKRGTGTGLMSCVLLTTGQWTNLRHFNAEYLLMHDPNMIRKHFSVELAEVIRDTVPVPSIHMSTSIPMIHYHRWEGRKSGAIPLEQMMSKMSLCKWLHAHFLKICLPSYRHEICRVFAPLNMTMFMRLVVHMGHLGYPGHWLSEIIKSLSSGDIHTAARALPRPALGPNAVDKNNALRAMCVKPWRAEFTTLVTQWKELFPFATVIPSGILPSPEIITEYSIKIPLVPSNNLSQPHFMLVFWNQRKYGEPPDGIYRLLLDDENGDMTTSAQKIRSDGINILSTFKWVSDEMTATFWLRSDVVDLMLKEDWTVCIWRIDSWVRYTPGQPLGKYLSKKRTWKECVTPA
ncbi:uncharacterized protein GGS22DRAFT_189057 [Annulohypoxylon maeteangense]|uniref:uncharacterized protein n=1 Tax=Annulohypoxylon maeteangense TaxID=1927788 RepID=UPI002008B311|nr:uncharacterized protein GGS22DRAFT_189057 [Annulohypoxylon maeteangense]KAI0884846.1 hypothetical protein GGS22DRAFT_189057 [Annulohypoxylon maeteangense]